MLQGLKPSLPIADVFPVVSSEGFLVNKFIFIMQAAVKMHGIVFIFQICAVAIASIVFPKMVKKNEGILNRQSLLRAKVYSHSFQKLLIFLSKKFKKLFVKFVEYYNLVLNKTCNDNGMSWKQRRLFSRKCTVKIHKIMVRIIYAIKLAWFFERFVAND